MARPTPPYQRKVTTPDEPSATPAPATPHLDPFVPTTVEPSRTLEQYLVASAGIADRAIMRALVEEGMDQQQAVRQAGTTRRTTLTHFDQGVRTAADAVRKAEIRRSNMLRAGFVEPETYAYRIGEMYAAVVVTAHEREHLADIDEHLGWAWAWNWGPQSDRADALKSLGNAVRREADAVHADRKVDAFITRHELEHFDGAVRRGYKTALNEETNRLEHMSARAEEGRKPQNLSIRSALARSTQRMKDAWPAADSAERKLNGAIEDLEMVVAIPVYEQMHRALVAGRAVYIQRLEALVSREEFAKEREAASTGSAVDFLQFEALLRSRATAERGLTDGGRETPT